MSRGHRASLAGLLSISLLVGACSGTGGGGGSLSPGGEWSPAGPAPTPTPEPTPVQVEFRKALAAGQVSMAATGEGLQSLGLRVSSNVDQTLEVGVEAGTVFDPSAGKTQSMVVIGAASVVIAGRETEELELDVACIEMHRDQPDDTDRFKVRTTATSSALLKLLRLPAFADEEFRVQQFAIWTITDNPAKDGYVGIGTFGLGSGPSKTELARIKALFKTAGIATAKYRALK